MDTIVGHNISLMLQKSLGVGLLYFLAGISDMFMYSSSRAGYVNCYNRTHNTRMWGLSPKWARIIPNGTHPGLFQIRFQYILAQRRQNVLKSDLKKSRICPIWGQSDPFWSQTYHPCYVSSDDTTVLVLSDTWHNLLHVRRGRVHLRHPW